MKAVTYNIQYCKGRDDIVDPKRIADEVSGADIIALQEVDRHWPRTNHSDQVAELTSQLPDYYWVYGPGIDLHLPGSTPENNLRRQFGNMVLSKFPIDFSRNHLLPKIGSIDALSIQRSCLETTINLGDNLLRVSSIHTSHLSSEDRLPQIERVIELHCNAEYEGTPVQGDLSGKDYESGVSNQETATFAMVMGDFNCQPDTPEYLAMTGPLSDYGGQVTSPGRFVDAWTWCGGEKESGHTSDVNDIPARLDYCFASTNMRKHLKKCWVDDTATGSDHLPLWVELDL